MKWLSRYTKIRFEIHLKYTQVFPIYCFICSWWLAGLVLKSENKSYSVLRCNIGLSFFLWILFFFFHFSLDRSYNRLCFDRLWAIDAGLLKGYWSDLINEKCKYSNVFYQRRMFKITLLHSLHWRLSFFHCGWNFRWFVLCSIFLVKIFSIFYLFILSHSRFETLKLVHKFHFGTWASTILFIHARCYPEATHHM